MSQDAADRLGKNVHVFDLNAEPEPVNGDLMDIGNLNDVSGNDVIDDGFGPIDDDDDYGIPRLSDFGNFLLLFELFV